ncbi:MAG: hypothetical protein FH748_12285 [Balneolaceae bacterium]|nr:hypothetical protein [Balneolaceae bacterium]
MRELQQNTYYHLFHKGINKGQVFWSEDDYKTFLEKYFYYLYPVAETFSYCLLGNHVHFLIRIRNEKEQKSYFGYLKSNFPPKSFHELVYENFKLYSASHQVGHLINSYTKYINSKYRRSGSLFGGNFKRKPIESEEYLLNLVVYIHRNPVHHSLTKDFQSYPFSSYGSLLSNNSATFIERAKVLELFGGIDNFVAANMRGVRGFLDDDEF